MLQEQFPSAAHLHTPIRSSNDELDLLELIHFVQANKNNLCNFFALFAGISLVGFTPWYFSRPRQIQGRVTLTFRGIEKSQYPDGKKFSIEDFRAPVIIQKALADAKLAPEDISRLGTLDVNVTQVIPQAVLKKWQKEDKDSETRYDYAPNEFDISLPIAGLSDTDARRLFSDILKEYREQLKSQQIAALKVANDPARRSYEELSRSYDYIDMPMILELDAKLLNDYLDQLSPQVSGYSDPVLPFEFRGIQNDLKMWSATRLDAMKGMIFQGNFVKNKESILIRTRYQLDGLDAQIRSLSEEMDQTTKFLQSIPRTQSVVANASRERDQTSTYDSAVLDRLIASDYMAPLIKRISDLREQIQALKLQKWSLERELVELPKARIVDPANLPANFRNVFEAGSRELQSIIGDYNGLLDRYMMATVTNLITVTEGPVISRAAPPLGRCLLGILFGAAALAFACAGLLNAMSHR